MVCAQTSKSLSAGKSLRLEDCGTGERVYETTRGACMRRCVGESLFYHSGRWRMGLSNMNTDQSDDP